MSSSSSGDVRAALQQAQSRERDLELQLVVARSAPGARSAARKLAVELADCRERVSNLTTLVNSAAMGSSPPVAAALQRQTHGEEGSPLPVARRLLPTWSSPGYGGGEELPHAAAPEPPRTPPRTPSARSAATPRSASPLPSVFERLTDARNFSGMHKERFFEDGRGKGKAGREYLTRNDGFVNSPGRKQAIESSSIERSPAHRMDERFSASRSIHVFKNGDLWHAGELFIINSSVRTLDQLLRLVTKRVPLDTGAVRHLYDRTLTTPVRSLAEFRHGEYYLCTGGEDPIMEALPHAWFA